MAGDQGWPLPGTRINRRAVLAGGLGLAAGIAAGMRSVPAVAARQTPPATPTAAGTPGATTSAPPMVTVFPTPGSRTASTLTEISFRGIAPERIGTVKVIGNQSGWHSGSRAAHSDGVGASLILDVPLQASEQVTVTTSLPVRGGQQGTFSFTVARQVAQPVRIADRTMTSQQGSHTYRSRPDLIVPNFTVKTTAPDRLAPGLIFWGPITTESQNGALILDNTAEPVWFSPLALGPEEDTDFRTQTYRGKPVLTYWQGISAGGHGLGHGVLLDQSYQPVATVHVGNGFSGTDLHELRLTDRDTALVTVFNAIVWDLTAVGGPVNGEAIDGIMQEIDIATGRVLFEWHSLDHIGLDESEVGYSAKAGPYDYFHINSVEPTPDDNLIISARNTWGIYKIERATGNVLWRLGGKKSDFQMGPGTATAFQHDARILANGDISVFDNGASPQVHNQSRGIIVRLDPTAKTATLVKEYTHSPAIVAGAEANTQILPNGNIFIGWGTAPYASEYSADGELLLDLSSTSRSYRAYRLPWTGHPAEPPAVAATSGPGAGMTVFASWNGATEVASWQVLLGSSPDQLEAAGSVPRHGFETTALVSAASKYVAVEARDSAGQPLGRSPAIEPTAS